jgi:hypothetical protein
LKQIVALATRTGNQSRCSSASYQSDGPVAPIVPDGPVFGDVFLANVGENSSVGLC